MKAKADAAINGYWLRPPGWPWQLWVGVLGDHLVASTDPDVLDLLRAMPATPPTLPWAASPEGPGALLALHHRLPRLDTWNRWSLFEAGPSGGSTPDDLLQRTEFLGEDLSSIPRSAKTRRLEREHELARRAKVEEQRRRFEERAIVQWDDAEALGLTTTLVQPSKRGLTIELTHDRSPARYLETTLALLDLPGSIEDLARRSESTPAEEREAEAQQRLIDSRREDVLRTLRRRRAVEQPRR